MHLLFLIYDSSVDAEITKVLRQSAHAVGCQCHYTKIRDAEGVGTTGIREGTWEHPGSNNVIFCAACPEEVEAMTKALEEFRAKKIETEGDAAYLSFKMIVVPIISLK